MGPTAPRLNHLTVRVLLHKDHGYIVHFPNALLVLRTPTQRLSMARITWVPKSSTSSGPGDHSPIAVTFFVLLLPREILARRSWNLLAFLLDGKKKRTILWPAAYEVNGVSAQPLGFDQQVEYLDLQFTWKGRVQQPSAGKLESTLLSITKGSVKLHQRLDILARFALPKLYHELVLGMAHWRTFNSLNVVVHARVRGWLRLPKDTVLGFFHARPALGGLDLPNLSTTIPLAQRARMECLAWSSLALARMTTLAFTFHHLVRQAKIPIRVGSSVATSKDDVVSDWSVTPFNLTDGLGLRNFPMDRASHLW
ncbi:hypothetical protein D915_010417 [Fasciola hepatica]|uniref:Uncharacterized protein n=1 Tax=Fasciola hepatica TaxID=6192 RepID=A0A4E0QUP1_FASHE|nr:hypothetical protein D915_010417 [Fasciola hepatica]